MTNGPDPWVVGQTLASFLALVVGLYAIRVAYKQAEKARRDLLIERRAAHRLDVLRSLAELWGYYGGVIAADQRLQGMLLALPADWFELLHAWTGVEPTDKGQERLGLLVEREADRRKATNPDDGEHFRRDRSRWPEAITSDVTSELRRRIAETAGELPSLEQHRARWRDRLRPRQPDAGGAA